MRYRMLGRTGFRISEVALGTWQVGGRWGEPFDEGNSERILNRAVDLGINFIDTADVYGERLSERAIGRVLKHRSERVYVATKCGRRLRPHSPANYSEANIRRFVDESLGNLGLEVIDLVQLHCPPTEIYYNPAVFEVLDELKKEGKILSYGVSVERVEEALKAIEYPGLATVQIIFNIFRQRPAELFFPQAADKNIGIIVRVPLASGLLSGKITERTKFGEKDHRFFNREGKAFDRGETFAGVDFASGLRAVRELEEVFPDPEYLARYALRWVLMFDQVSCVIPGASRSSQVEDNAGASDMPPLSRNQMERIGEIYSQRIKPAVHQRW